jgi:hypothetical protein
MQPASSLARGAPSSNPGVTGQRPPIVLGQEDDQPSPGKRQKLVHTTSGSCVTPVSASNQQKMYSFNNPVVDLTSSPPGVRSSPQQQRRISGATRPTNVSFNTTAKRLNVKNLKTKSKTDPDSYREKIWKQISEALQVLFDQETKPFSLEELYRGVENVCKQGQAEIYFSRLRTRCTERFQRTIVPDLLAQAVSTSDADVVKLVVHSWETWRRQMVGTVCYFGIYTPLTGIQNTIRSIFYYLDRSYLLRSPKEPSLEELGIVLFRQYVFEEPKLMDKIIGGICDLLAADRQAKDGQIGQANLFKDSIAMSQALSSYATIIEPKILGRSQEYFVDWQESHASSTDLALYVDAVNELTEKETERCRVYGLDSSTRRELEEQIKNFVIIAEVQKLTDGKELENLMNDNRLNSLKSIFGLLQSVGQQLKLQKPFEAYIIKQGSSIIFDEQRELEMVPRLLQFKKKLDVIVMQCFGKTPELVHTLREAFETFINRTKKSESNHNTDNDKTGEMIAKYVDLILRGGSKAIPQIAVDDSLQTNQADEQEADNDDLDEDAQINKQLDQVLELFRFVAGKAVFEAFYKTALAKRLLMNRSASADAEKSMLARLKNECGSNFTHNLEQMFKDVELARDENSGFKSVIENRRGKVDVDLSVNVCSAAAWPSYPDVEVEIPLDIQKACADYEQYYKSKYSGRKLQWKHAQSHCQMTANFPKGRKEVVVSGFQSIVMMYFNDKPAEEPVTYSELKSATKLQDGELKRTLQSLACARYRVLTKVPKGKDVNETDKFLVNMSFTDAKYRIKINQIQLKETKEENKQTHERVAADRQFETQAAIVRIMKGKKKINHPLLVAEVINATKSRGAINAEDIKKQIEK